MAMVNVFNPRNNKKGKAEKISDTMYTVIFEDGEQKEVKASSFERWYQVLETTDLESGAAPDADTPAGDADPADANAAADAEAKEAEKAAKEAEEKAAKEAAAAAKKAEKEAAAAAKKKEKEDAKAAKDAEAAAKRAEKEAAAAAAKAEKEAAAAAAKAAKEAAAAAKAANAANAAPRDGSTKKAHKEFFTKFLAVLNAKEDSVTKANARERNYMSFPAGASGFKFKFVKTGDKLDCSLYIFGPQIVTTALFNELTKYKAEVDARLKLLDLDWSAPEDLKVRRVRTTLTGTDAELIDLGVKVLMEFRAVFIPLIDKITKG